MNSSDYIFEVTAENFEQVILQGSQSVPVLIDFWASWCQPCKSLMPILTSLAEAYQGKFILAKINTEEQQELATQFGIRSIPTVKLFKEGAEVDEFMGALPEAEIRAFLDRHIPRESDDLVIQADLLIQQGDTEGAKKLLDRAKSEDPENSRILTACARLQAILGNIDEAETLLAALPVDEQDIPEVAGLRARFTFDRTAQAAPTAETLKQRLEINSSDSEALYQLAAHRVMENAHEEAMELLLQLLCKDRSYGDDAARKGLLALFDLLGGSGELVNSYRKQMFNALH
ncbi:MAG: thioredoxin [Candidatus Sedimenticola sp. (ex Thyasira tokunagai)]